MSDDYIKTRGPIAWMANNHVAANLLMLMLLLGGLFIFRIITQEVFPDMQANTVTISVAYRGASPEEVERGIIEPIEDSLTGIVGIDEVASTASEGSGSVQAELIDSADPMQVYQDIQSEVDRITTFPDDAEKPVVKIDVRRRGVLTIALYGDATDPVLKQLSEWARDRFLEHENITQVDLLGTRDLEIGVEITQENLRRYGLTLQDVATKLASEALELPGGGVDTSTGEVLVRLTERRDYGSEFGRLPIVASADGTRLLLKDIATITDGLEDTDSYALMDGKPAVLIEIYRVGNQTPMEVAAAAFEQMEKMRTELPDGMALTVHRNMADIYKQRAELLLRNGAIGLVLVLLLLGTFLELRLAFWVMLGIPISFLGSLLLMPVTGLSLNMVTLFAYILSLGIVVDDAIVVGENVYRLHQTGMPFKQAAIQGTLEVSGPVAFSILTNMVAFVPLMVLPGMMGRILRMLPIVVTSVFLLSWVECVFVLPAHLGSQKDACKRKGVLLWIHNGQQRFSHAFLRWVDKVYAPFLGRCLDHRYLVLAVAFSILMITLGYVCSGRMGFQMFPKVESDYAYASISMPYGVPIERTRAAVEHLTAAAKRVVDACGHPELVEGIYAGVGQGGTHRANIRVFLADAEIRDNIMSTSEFVKRWRKETGRVPGAEMVRFEADRGGPGSGPALTVELSHSEVSVLESAAVALSEKLGQFPMVSDVDDGFQLGKEQLSFTLLPEARSLGLNSSDIARQVRNAYEGAEVLRQQRGRNELRVQVRLTEAERDSLGSLKKFILRTPDGGEVPLGDVVNIERGRAYTTINHRNGRRTMTVTANVTPRAAAGQVQAKLDADILPLLMRRYPGLTASYEGRQAEDRKSQESLMVTLPMVLLAIYALLAIPFKSYSQPLIVMASIPFGLVGAVLGHLIMGYSLSMIGLIGIVALCGVVVNDSLVLVDFINRHRQESADLKTAIINGGVQRFRPILLTTLTTFGGLAPMIFETSRQARFLIPMAISLGYGLLFATTITLILVPALYMMVEDLRKRRVH